MNICWNAISPIEREFSCNNILLFDVPACRQMEFGIQAIFGPSDPLLGAHIQSICEALDIPHVEARIDFEPSFKEFSINLHPSQEHMNHAFKDVMTFLNWTKVAIIYEEDYGEISLFASSLGETNKFLIFII